MIYTDLQEYDNALNCFNKGLALKSNDAYLLNNRGYIHLLKNQPDVALKDINESIVIDPDNPWAYRNKAIYYFMMGEDSDAERLLLQSIKMDNSIALSHFYLGNIFLKNGSQVKACEEFLVSLQLGDLEGEKAYRQYCQ
jgi:tetratricopeptide (TPR) repeat protein